VRVATRRFRILLLILTTFAVSCLAIYTFTSSESSPVAGSFSEVASTTGCCEEPEGRSREADPRFSEPLVVTGRTEPPGGTR
jgi:hypothetical protein